MANDREVGSPAAGPRTIDRDATDLLPDGNDVSARVAAGLRQRRKESGLTLAEAAERAGMSASQLSRMERAEQAISVVDLITFAKLYGGKVTDYFLVEDDRPIKVTRFGERTRSIRNITVDGNVVQEHLISAGNVEFTAVIIFMPPKACSGDPLTHDGTELLTVTDGSLVVWLGETEISLDRGDSVYFDATIPHYWQNPADRPASVLAIASPAPGGPHV